MKKIIAELEERGFKKEAAILRQILAYGYSLLKFKGTDNEIKALREWLDSLRLSYGKAPKGLKEEFKWLQFLQRQFDVAKEYNIPVNVNNIKAVLSRWNKSTIDKIQNALSGTNKETELRLKNATYINNSLLNTSKFKELAKKLDNFINNLKGFHAKALKKPLTVHFVKKSVLKSKAKYKSDKDEIYIRPDYIKISDNYGSFSYILVHELGHRYLKLFGKSLKTNFSYPEWYTTPYSKKQTMSEEEPFAELFALSHWASKYTEYKEKINKFIKILK